jgi:hypothetical protein
MSTVSMLRNSGPNVSMDFQSSNIVDSTRRREPVASEALGLQGV